MSIKLSNKYLNIKELESLLINIKKEENNIINKYKILN